MEVREAVPVELPGDHNAWNAAAVLEMARACGCEEARALAAIRTFAGVERRLELCSPPGQGPRVFDDYAHNPEKLFAAIRAVRPEKGRLVVLWRPHGFAPLQQNFEAFVQTFAEGLRDQDELRLLPVFYAGGTAPKGVGSEDLAGALRGRGVQADVMETYPDRMPLAEEDVLLVAGARDPELPAFARRMGQRVGRP